MYEAALFGEDITDPEVVRITKIMKIVDRYNWIPPEVERLPMEWIDIISQWNDGLDNARQAKKDLGL